MPLLPCRYFLLKHQCLGTGTVFLVDLRWTRSLGSRAVTSCISTTSGLCTSCFSSATLSLLSFLSFLLLILGSPDSASSTMSSSSKSLGTFLNCSACFLASSSSFIAWASLGSTILNVAKILLKVLYMGSRGSSSSSSWMYSTSTSLVSSLSRAASPCRRLSASWTCFAHISGLFFFFFFFFFLPFSFGSLFFSFTSSSSMSSMLSLCSMESFSVSSATGGGPAGWLWGGVILIDRLVVAGGRSSLVTRASGFIGSCSGAGSKTVSLSSLSSGCSASATCSVTCSLMASARGASYSLTSA